MSDLGAGGTVDYSNMHSHSVRADQTNATDIRRTVGVFPSIHMHVDLRQTNTADTFQTIKDITGVATAIEGVEIQVSGSTQSGALAKYRSHNTLVKLGGITGAVVSPPTGESLQNVFVVERTPFDESIGFGPDVNNESNEGIFIPITDLSQISIAGITNKNSAVLTPWIGGSVENYESRLEIRIK